MLVGTFVRVGGPGTTLPDPILLRLGPGTALQLLDDLSGWVERPNMELPPGKQGLLQPAVMIYD